MRFTDDRTLDLPFDEEQKSGLAKIPPVIKTKVALSDVTGLTLLSTIDGETTGTFFPNKATTESDLAGAAAAATDKRFSTPVEALYPHWQDANAGVGLAIYHLGSVIKSLEAAMDSIDDANAEALNHIVHAEAGLFRVSGKADFHKPFEVLANFCAWAIRSSGIETPRNSATLASMCSAVRELKEHPFLGLPRAADIIIELKRQGWKERSPIAALFLQGVNSNDESVATR